MKKYHVIVIDYGAVLSVLSVKAPSPKAAITKVQQHIAQHWNAPEGAEQDLSYQIANLEELK